mgnify:CR=1 FL=1
MNYFSYLCFFGAIIGLISRFIIFRMGKSGKVGIRKSLYRKKPFWIYAAAVFGILLIVYTWIKVFTTEIKYSWLIALLFSLTSIKIFFIRIQKIQKICC